MSVANSYARFHPFHLYSNAVKGSTVMSREARALTSRRDTPSLAVSAGAESTSQVDGFAFASAGSRVTTNRSADLLTTAMQLAFWQVAK